MSYFPCDIPFMSDEELKENGIVIHKDEETVDGDTISRQATINAIQKHFNPTGGELSPDLASVLAGVSVVIWTMPSASSRQPR